MAVLLSGANYIWHSAGWNEAGMHCSMAKFIVDAEQCAMGYRMAEGLNWDDFDEALSAVRDIGPAGTILAIRTRRSTSSAPSSCRRCLTTIPMNSGAPKDHRMTARALATAKALLASYEQPPIETATDEALRDYIARREREIPAMDALNQ